MLKSNNDWLEENLILFLIFILPFRLFLSDYFVKALRVLPDMIIGVLLIRKLIKDFKRLKYNKVDFFVLCFMIISFFITLFVKAPIFNYIIQLRALFLYYILYFIIKNLEYIDNQKFLQKIIKVLNIAVFILFFLVTIEFCFDKQVLFPQQWIAKYGKSNFKRVYSFVNNPNTFGAFITLVYSIYYFGKKNIKKIEHIILMVILHLTLFLTSSVSSITIYLLLIIFIFYSSKHKKEILTLFLISLIISFISINTLTFFKSKSTNFFKKEEIVLRDEAQNTTLENDSKYDEETVKNNEVETKIEIKETVQSKRNVFFERITNLFTKEYFQNSVEDGRLYRVKLSYKISKDNNYFGTGLGTFGSSGSLVSSENKLYEKYKIPQNFYAESQYLSILVETGIIGFLSFLFIIFAIYKTSRKNKLKIYFILSFIILSAIYNVFEIQVLSSLFWIIISLNLDFKDNEETLIK